MKHAILPRYEADPVVLRRTFSYFPSGVVTLLAQVDDEPRGLVAATFTVGVSIDPPLALCAIQNTSGTWPLLRQVERIGVSVLAEGQADLGLRIASKDPTRRFVDVPLRTTGGSAVFVAGAAIWFECSIHSELPAGDHTVVLLEILGLGAEAEERPLIFHGSTFRGLDLPAAEAPADTAQGSTP